MFKHLCEGHTVKNWKIRYFVIKEKNILYYKDASLKVLKGQFSIAGASVNKEDKNIDGRQK
jgi:hypothetical protein